jgi:hypothetical protein
MAAKETPMRLPQCLPLCLPLILALAALPVFAQATPNLSPTTGTSGTGTPGAAARLIEAHRLYQLGLTTKDALLVLTAARLMQGVTLREVTRTVAEPLAPQEPDPKTDKASKADKSDKTPKQDPPPVAAATKTETETGPATIVPDPGQFAPLPGALVPKAMFATARAFAPGTSPLRDMIADAESEVPPPGMVALVSSLIQSAGGSTTFALPLAGESYGEVGLLRLPANSDPTGHLTMTVTDAAGNPVCVDASASASALCGIVPKESGLFRVTVVNDGTAPAAYLLITN